MTVTDPAALLPPLEHQEWALATHDGDVAEQRFDSEDDAYAYVREHDTEDAPLEAVYAVTRLVTTTPWLDATAMPSRWTPQPADGARALTAGGRRYVCLEDVLALLERKARTFDDAAHVALSDARHTRDTAHRAELVGKALRDVVDTLRVLA